MFRFALPLFIAFVAAGPAHSLGNLEVPAPASVQSGITAISGWHCTASRIEVSIDGGPKMAAGAKTSRLDTQATCGRSDTGFSLLYNFNVLPVDCFGCRFHTITAYADGVAFANATFEVEHYRTEFLTGKKGEYNLNNFPEVGDISVLRWDEAKQGFGLYLAEGAACIPTATGSCTHVAFVANDGSYFGALRIGAQNPACGPFPPDRKIGTRPATFTVQTLAGRMALSIDYADGATCALPSVGVPAQLDPDGYLVATWDAPSSAACPEFANGLTVRVNGERLYGDSGDTCRTAHVIGAK